MKNKKMILGIIAVVLIVVIFVLAFFMDKGTEEKSGSLSPTADKNNAANVVEWEGSSYYQNQNLTTVLFVGVDNNGPVQDSGLFYNEGQCDFLMLAVFDKSTESVSLLHINRDTITPVTMLGLGGKDAGKAEMQIALSHCYGSGLQDSCKNTVSAVSELLKGSKIDHYFMMNMDGVALLNDAVGGVTVTIEDQFEGEPDFVVGETITLKGSQALTYVRGRSDVADGTNVNRMQRQRNYIRKFIDNFDAMASSEDFVTTTITLISDYSVTDMTLEQLSSIANQFSEYTLGEVRSFDGTLNYESSYVEFYVDDADLTRQLVELMYIPENEKK